MDEIFIDTPKTKTMKKILGNLRILENSVLLLLSKIDHNIYKSGRNLPGVNIIPCDSINVYDILRHDYLVIPLETVRILESKYAN